MARSLAARTVSCCIICSPFGVFEHCSMCVRVARGRDRPRAV